MDLVSKRYASPFLLFDELIANCELSSFITELIEITNEEEIYKLWLHKVFDKSFNDFRKQVIERNKVVQTSNENVTETISASMKILENYIPEERG